MQKTENDTDIAAKIQQIWGISQDNGSSEQKFVETEDIQAAKEEVPL